jgi:5-formyltetrahydrofolate cyclo-ligase
MTVPVGDDPVRAARRLGRSARRRLSGASRAEAEARLGAHLLALPELRGPGTLALTVPTDGEVDLGGTVGALRDRGWELHLPVVRDDRSLAFRPWRDGDVLVANRYGIGEPAADGRRDRSADELDVVVVPCTSVDRRGTRLGFGAGYYDRTLAAATGTGRPRTVCVAFDVQVVADLPVREWDVPVQVLVTESGADRLG